MISFDLKCTHDHVFEVWFRSSADYESQRSAGLLMCPVCGDTDVAKAVMAPAVAAKGNQRSTPVAPNAPSPMPQLDPAEMGALMRKLAEAQAKTLNQSEWVGKSFADRARAMYYGEAEQKLIHGTADLRETREMLEEGLPVAPLLVPMTPPDQTH